MDFYHERILELNNNKELLLELIKDSSVLLIRFFSMTIKNTSLIKHLNDDYIILIFNYLKFNLSYKDYIKCISFINDNKIYLIKQYDILNINIFKNKIVSPDNLNE